MINNWNEKILDMFNDFSSEEFQKTAWFGLSDEITSPDEMCNWIDDLDLFGWMETQKFEQKTSLSKDMHIFMGELEKLPDYDDPLEAFASSEWQKIRLMAGVILEALRKHISNGKRA